MCTRLMAFSFRVRRHPGVNSVAKNEENRLPGNRDVASQLMETLRTKTYTDHVVSGLPASSVAVHAFKKLYYIYIKIITKNPSIIMGSL